MSETTHLHGGAHHPAEARVSADQTTILGDGTAENPLRAGPGSVVQVTVAADADGETVLGDGTVGHPLRTNPDGVPVAVDGVTVLGDGTRGDPLRAVASTVTTVTTVAAATDGVTILGDGTVADPLRASPDGVPVVADQVTITGDGTRGNPLQATRQVAALLPMALHGAAFRVSGASNALIGVNGLIVPFPSGVAKAVAAVPLPAGTRVATVTVRLTDGTGTPVEAHFGAEDGSVLQVSELSRGDGTTQELTVEVGQVLQSGTGYFLDVVNPSGNAGWALHSATLA